MTDPSLLVLSSLSGGDKHGYAIMRDIECFAGVRLGPGTLYGAITRLEERGMIRAIKTSGRRQPYAIRAEGRTSLQEQLVALDKTVRTGLRRLRHI
ncbi:MAG: PadR family transcriptional regulator [Acidobacteriota bacterium]|nr:PadR family transcriptional regulator [Acidobacteriota bacterium]